MILYLFLIVISPFTALIPGFKAVYEILCKKLRIHKNYWNMGMLSLFLWSVIVAIINKGWLSLGGSFLILLFFAITVKSEGYFTNREKIHSVLKYTIYLTGVTSIIGLLEKLIFTFMGVYDHQIFGNFGNPNMTAAWLDCVILITIYLRKITEDKKVKKIFDWITFLNVLVIVFTKSSGAVIAMLVALVIYIILKNADNKKFLMKFIATLACIITIVSIVEIMDKSDFVKTELIKSYESRVDIWQGSMEMMKEKPVTGWGILSVLEHGNEYNTVHGNTTHSHNIWLTFLVCTGVVGLIIYLYMKLRLMKDFYTLFKRREPLLPLLVGINTIMVVQGLVDVPLYAPQVGMLYMASAAITINLVKFKVED